MYPRFTMILGGPIVDPAVFEHNSVKYFHSQLTTHQPRGQVLESSKNMLCVSIGLLNLYTEISNRTSTI